VAIWIALGVFVVGLVAGLVFAVVRGIVMWRRMKRMSGELGPEVERISRVAEEIQQQLERANASATELTAATERLRLSVARLQIQLAAVHEARTRLARTFWFVPGI
jgi:type VI protein secretion system component VasK